MIPCKLHLLWTGQSFKFMHLLTVLSFRKYHGCVPIVLHVNDEPLQNKWWSYLLSLPNISVKHVSYNHPSPQSWMEYYKWVVLEHGGLFSQFDILYFKNSWVEIMNHSLVTSSMKPLKYHGEFIGCSPHISLDPIISQIQGLQRCGAIVEKTYEILEQQYTCFSLPYFYFNAIEASYSNVNTVREKEKEDNIWGIHWFGDANPDISNLQIDEILEPVNPFAKYIRDRLEDVIISL